MPNTGEQLYTLRFLLLCLSTALFSASFNMFIPELPDYLTSLGGEDYKGLIISLFTIMAGLSRPFSGKLTDTIGRLPVMIFGTLVCVICSLIYPLVTGVAGFLLLRFFHGFSTGFKPTATTAFTADISPIHRRGEAMGVLGISMNVGASISPPFGSYLAMEYGIDTLFYFSSFVALISIVILLQLKETLPNKQSFRPKHLLLKRNEWIEKRALMPAVVIMLVYFSYGILLTITPDHAKFVGMQNKGFFFTALTLASLASRLFAGKISDKYGRIPVLKVAAIMLTFALYFFGQAMTPRGLLFASAFLGFSSGIAAPAAFAWVIDRAKDERRGMALATAYIALEIGISGGAVISALIYANESSNLPQAYYFGAILSFLALIYLQFVLRRVKE